MLQINSGKLFSRRVGRENALRGVLYSNLQLYDAVIETAAGKLLYTSTLRNSHTLVFEMTERIEAPESGPEFLVSHGAEPFLKDFSTVVAFGMNVTCTPDADLLKRLLSDQPGISTFAAPKKVVRRVFDDRVSCGVTEAREFSAFISQLLGLERKVFLGAMRAIRTYVTAMHRIADDLNLAYTMLVASLESLAQDFDGHRATWEDYEEKKRKPTEAALEGAPPKVAERVKAALLEIEHTSLGRRFRDFTLSFVAPGYFREEALSQEAPIGRSDLADALAVAYKVRSKYIHNLEELPRFVTLGHSFAETERIDGITTLTLQGLSRLARHVIMNFVMTRTTVDHEKYDYWLEQSGIVRAPLAPQLWIGLHENIAPSSGKARLEGFAELLAPIVQGSAGASMVDLRQLLLTVEKTFATSTKVDRRPFLILHLLFNRSVAPDSQTANFVSVLKPYMAEMSEPSSEALLAYQVTGQPIDWSLDSHKQTHDTYFKRRDRSSGIRFPKLFEVGFSLTLAERYRAMGNMVKARELISLAVENYPGNNALGAFEKAFVETEHISWSAIMMQACGQTDD
jgi:hypothetical protein